MHRITVKACEVKVGDTLDTLGGPRDVVQVKKHGRTLISIVSTSEETERTSTQTWSFNTMINLLEDSES